MNPYEVLGLKRNATLKQIKHAWRQAAKFHPDNLETGNREKFEEAKLAYDILSDPERRKRYDLTGRTDENRVTPEKIKMMVEQAMRAIVDAEREDGTTDDPVWDNIRDKMLATIHASRAQIRNERFKLQRKLERVTRLAERFKPKQEEDPIGEFLATEKKTLQNNLNFNEDAMTLSLELEKVFKNYDYEVGPGPEGHNSPGPTLRLRGTFALPRA